MATLYDGLSGVAHPVALSAGSAVLVIERESGEAEHVPASELTLLDRSSAGLTIGRPSVDGWRLRAPAPVLPELDALFPRRHGYGRWIDRFGLWPAAGAFTAVSASVLALGYFAPTLLAPFVPASVEKAYGEALVGDFGGKYCASPRGVAALQRLTARLDPNAAELNVRVVDVPIVNAAALPAGNIVLFKPLLTDAKSPEELAGVLAHEIAHVRKRHVTAALIRQFGIGVVTSALGGPTAGRVDGFVSLSFTRRGEIEADDTAIAMLDRAGISPGPTAGFFRRIGGGSKKELGRFEPALTYFSTHPLSDDRAKKFSAAERKGKRYTPALTPREWTDLRAICSTRQPAR